MGGHARGQLLAALALGLALALASPALPSSAPAVPSSMRSSGPAAPGGGNFPRAVPGPALLTRGAGIEKHGLMVTTLNGELYGFDMRGNMTWQYSFGAPLIHASAADDADDATGAAAEPRLWPALDGTLFLTEGGRVEHMWVSIRQIVDASPIKVSVVPDAHLTGERRSRVHTIELPVASAAADGSRSTEGKFGEVCSALACSAPSQKEEAVKKLRFGATQWSIAAVDDASQAERWSLTYHEIAGIPSQPVPSSVREAWLGRVKIHGRSVTLQVPPAAQSLGTCAAKVRGGAAGGEGHGDDDGSVDGSSSSRTFAFDSEVLAAFVFSEPASRNASDALGLEVIVHAAPELVPLLDMRHSSAARLSMPDARTSIDVAGGTHPSLQPLLPRAAASRLFVAPPSSGEGRPGLVTLADPQARPPHLLPYEATASGRTALIEEVIAARGRRRPGGLPLPPAQPTLLVLALALGVAVAAASMCATLPPLRRMRRPVSRPLVVTPPVMVTRAEESCVVGPLPPPAEKAGAPPEGDSLSSSPWNGHFKATFTDAGLIGVGGFGAVYKAKHRLEGGWYAVKLVPMEGLEDWEAVSAQRDFGEVLNLQRLDDSRHVVRFFTSWCEEPHFLVREMLDVGGLRHLHCPGRASGAAALRGSRSEPALQLSARFLAEPAGDGEAPSASDTYHASSMDSLGSCGICFEAEPPSSHGGKRLGSRAGRTHGGTAGGHASRDAAPTRSSRRSGAGPRRHAQAADEDLCKLVRPQPEQAMPQFRTVLMIQMELCTGPTLRSWLDSSQRPRVPLSFLRKSNGQALELIFIRHLMKGIRAFHAADLVHRDLKPQNLFVTQNSALDEHDAVLKVGDFGLSRRTRDEHVRENGQVGTPAYCAPEGGVNAAAPVDIFSAALIILELLCPPLGTIMERAQLLEALRGESQGLPAHIDESLPSYARLVRRMAQRQPHARPTAAEVLVELKRIKEEEAAAAAAPASG